MSTAPVVRQRSIDRVAIRGSGLRAAWFPTRVLGFGYDLHLIKLNDVAPGLASTPREAFLEDSQSMFGAYVRWKR